MTCSHCKTFLVTLCRDSVLNQHFILPDYKIEFMFLNGGVMGKRVKYYQVPYKQTIKKSEFCNLLSGINWGHQ